MQQMAHSTLLTWAELHCLKSKPSGRSITGWGGNSDWVAKQQSELTTRVRILSEKQLDYDEELHLIACCRRLE